MPPAERSRLLLVRLLRQQHPPFLRLFGLLPRDVEIDQLAERSHFHSRANWRARWSAAAELGEGLVRRDGGEPFARGLALGSQTVEQTQGLTIRKQLR